MVKEKKFQVNRKAVLSPKRAALCKHVNRALTPHGKINMKPPQCSEKEDQLAESLKRSKHMGRWWVTPNEQVLTTAKMLEILLKKKLTWEPMP